MVPISPEADSTPGNPASTDIPPPPVCLGPLKMLGMVGAAQIIMVLTLLLMVSGKVPLYLTAVIGGTIAALVAGVPFNDADVTIRTLLGAGLHPVLLDMLGVLLFIGIMESTGFLKIIIFRIMTLGKRVGGGPGVAAAGGISAGIIGGMTGFTQPAITGVVTGPASVKLGVPPNKSAGMHALAGILGNYGGFTHPTMVAVVATAGIGFGMINVVGIIVGLSSFVIAFLLMRRSMKAANARVADVSDEDLVAEGDRDALTGSFLKAIFPFLVLLAGLIAGFPIVLVGIVASLLVMLLARENPARAESVMMAGIHRISTPLFATVAFLFMSAVINHIGLVDLVADRLEPALNVAPILIMLLVSAVAGLITQSNGASAAIVVPFLAVVLTSGADPFSAAVAAAGGTAIMQYFLTGGPVAALSTVIPVIPGSELKAANRFQRPAILATLGVLTVIVLILMAVR